MQMREMLRGTISPKKMLTTKTLVVMALMVALKIILRQFTIYLTPSFKLINFDYLPGAMVSILYGPWAGLLFGFVGDTVGYLVKPIGPYFIGYTLSEMVLNFIYGLFLYRRPLKVWRVVAANVTILLTVYYGLNYIWNTILYGTAASAFFTSVRIINNLVQLPLSVLLLIITARMVLLAYKGGGAAKAVGYLKKE